MGSSNRRRSVRPALKTVANKAGAVMVALSGLSGLSGLCALGVLFAPLPSVAQGSTAGASSDAGVPAEAGASPSVESLMELGACPTPALPPDSRVPGDAASGRSVGADGAGHVDVLDRAALERIVASHDVTVLIWWSSTCPCVRRYHDRIQALASRWPEDRVAVITVSSNANEDPTAVVRDAENRGSVVPMLVDTGGCLAEALGVRTTPATVVLDRQQNLVFRGWIDNERPPGSRNREAFVEEAVEAALAGQSARSESPVYGCAITRAGRGSCD